MPLSKVQRFFHCTFIFKASFSSRDKTKLKFKILLDTKLVACGKNKLLAFFKVDFRDGLLLPRSNPPSLPSNIPSFNTLVTSRKKTEKNQSTGTIGLHAFPTSSKRHKYSTHTKYFWCLSPMLDADCSCCPLLATGVREVFAMSLQEQPSSEPYCSHGRRSYGYKE